MDLGHGMIQNPGAEVTEVVQYLDACEKTLASLYTLADCLISWQVCVFVNNSGVSRMLTVLQLKTLSHTNSK